MRGGIIRSSFRKIPRGFSYKSNAPGPSTASIAAEQFRSSRRGFSTSDQKMKLMHEDWICPIKYFKEEVPLLEELDYNPLIKAAGGRRGRSLVAWEAGKAIRSLPELIAEHHARGETVGLALNLKNIGISRSEGRFGFLDTSGIGPPKKSGSLQRDWKLGGDVLAEISAKVLGDNPWPKDLSKYIKLMRSASAKNFRLLFYNSLFLGPRMRYFVRVFVDQRFRKDGDSLPRKTSRAVQKFLGKLPYEYGEAEVEGSLCWIAKQNDVVGGAMAEARVEAQMRRQKEMRKDREAEMRKDREAEMMTYNLKEGAKSEEDMMIHRHAEMMRCKAIKEGRKSEADKRKEEEEKWKMDSGRWVVCVNRDSLTHGTKTKPMYLKEEVKRQMLTAENIWQMLHVEFDELDQSYIELCDGDELLWKVLGMEEIFFETPDTWKRAREALREDIASAEASASAGR